MSNREDAITAVLELFAGPMPAAEDVAAEAIHLLAA
jgi:hypothetical protein